jgi:hypothetical protein
VQLPAVVVAESDAHGRGAVEAAVEEAGAAFVVTAVVFAAEARRMVRPHGAGLGGDRLVREHFIPTEARLQGGDLAIRGRRLVLVVPG